MIASRTPSILKTALACRCPRCGEGRLFKGLLTVTGSCSQCGLDLGAHDTGDGASVFVILIIGFIAVGLALWTEVRFEPPLWVHALLWTPLVTIGSIGLLRPLKAALIALEYRHRALGRDGS